MLTHAAWIQGRFVLAMSCVFALLAGCASGPKTVMRDGPPTVPPPAAVLAEVKVEPQVEPIRQGGPNKPYSVLGQSYRPMTDDIAWSEQGMASWYGKKFHGRRTASGELYSMYGMTAAHRTLPIPSYVRVRHARTGKSVVLRVNDRGPFARDRVIDVSYAAAVQLGLVGPGVGEVTVERLTFDAIRTGAWRQDGDLGVPLPDAAPPVAVAAVATMEAPTTGSLATPAAEPMPGAALPLAATATSLPTPRDLPTSPAYTPAARGFWVQLAALSRREGVERIQQQVARDLEGLLPMLAVFHESALYKLKIGPFASRHEAQEAAGRARQALQVQPLLVFRR